MAESCTGGLLGAALTSVPGSSAAFRGGLICYADDVKMALADVPPALVARHGAVSEAVAFALAKGAARRLSADLGLATTGIAGPSGGTPTKPVGTVIVAAWTRRARAVRRLVLSGGRARIRRDTVAAALRLALSVVPKRSRG